MSKGEWNTKVHALVDAQGLALEILLGPGNRHDIPMARALVGEHGPGKLLGDRGYCSGKLRT